MPHASAAAVAATTDPEAASLPVGALPATRLAVLGAGAWGTVLARTLAMNGHTVRLWCRRPERAEAIAARRCNAAYLPDLPLPATLQATADLADAVHDVEAAVVAVPSHAVESVMQRLPAVPALVSASKGFVSDQLTRVTEVLQRVHPESLVAVLSGPTIAAEVARDLPAAVTVASDDADLARLLQGWFGRPTFRVYVSRDVNGVEACGALKNVIALAAGMSDGLGLGANARAALVTRGLAELVRVGAALGGEPRTFYGLAGVGDLVATCSSTRSRNHQVGERIARGEAVTDIQASGVTAEGLATVRHVVPFADATAIELPICREVHRVTYEGKAPAEAISDLMTRAPRDE
jgi:glycerol-3-phosphate dehydrogenase (NAD(P)+)